MDTVYHNRATVDSIFQIGISQNTKCDNTVSFCKSGHILASLMYSLVLWQAE